MAQAAIAAGASILGGVSGKKGAKKAAKIQAAAYQKGIDEQARQFNITQQNEAPFLEGGTAALDPMMALLGLKGGTSEADAISGLKASPAFTSLYDTGADTILQNAAATGGLRGGNTQNSLAQFGSGLLSQVIQQRLGNLGGLVSLGSGTAGTLGQLGQAKANAQASLMGQQGGAQASGVLGQSMALQNMLKSLSNIAGGLNFGGGGGAAPYSGAGIQTSLQPGGITW